MAISQAQLTRLTRLGKEQERVALAEAERIAKENKARFEEDLRRRFLFLEREEWRKPMEEAEAAIRPLAARVEAECLRLGIPKYAAPCLSARWDQGGLQVAQSEIAEMRRLAFARIDADLAEAKATIKHRLATYNVAVLSDGLSEEARSILATLPSVADLLKPIAYERAKGFLIEEHAARARHAYHFEREPIYAALTKGGAPVLEDDNVEDDSGGAP